VLPNVVKYFNLSNSYFQGYRRYEAKYCRGVSFSVGVFLKNGLIPVPEIISPTLLYQLQNYCWSVKGKVLKLH